MSEFKPTAAQAAAMNTRASAVLVSAGAGSGKTKVLTERLMGYLTDEGSSADIDSFLIITFTRAAAGELRGRISEELARRIALDPGNRRLRRQTALCQRAQIGTIHSFCASVLRENSHLTGLSPDFKIADEDRAQSMKASALERVLDSRYENSADYPGFMLLADTVGAGRDDRRLTELVLTLYGKMQCHARPESWARKQVELLDSGVKDVSETPWGEEILGWVGRKAEYWAKEFDRLMEAMSSEEKISNAYMESVSATADGLRELFRSSGLGWDKAKECLPICFPKLKPLSKSPDPKLSELIKKRRDACKESMKKLNEMMSADSQKLLAEMALTAPAMKALLSLTLDFDAAYSRDKRRCGLVDYADLEHLTARLLTDEQGRPTQTAENISRRYTEIMVDEYQDVSQVQDTIFRAVSKNGSNLFMVGDVKQSIYRFRLADPGIFNSKYLSYADHARAAAGEARRIILQENFRSRKEILECANAVFGACMSLQLGEMNYNEDAKLKCGASYVGEGAIPEMLLIELPEEDDDDEESPDKVETEAQAAATKIRELVESGTLINDRGMQRPVEYGDIAILMRSANTVGSVYRRVLAAEGVPVAAGQGGSFFSSVEISTVMSMLAIIDNPHQDIPLIAVLRSPCFGFTADELSQIRTSDKKGDFYTALNAAAAESKKVSDFLAKLAAFRRVAADTAVGELVWQLIGELDMLAVCSAMADGAQRRANLMELIELAEKYESSGYRGLHRFVLWLRKLAERGHEPSIGSSGASAVQIMTVHKSKGLEFPIVFLCDTARRFNKQDSRETVLVHPELGLGPKVTDLKRRVEYPSLARNAIKLRLEREMLSEEMRLLYVALTRAKERMYITALTDNAEETVDKLLPGVTAPMAAEVLSGAQSLRDWLIYAALSDGQQHIKLQRYTRKSENEEKPEEDPAEKADMTAVDELRERLSYKYPHKEAVALPSKVTATELKGRMERDEDAASSAPAAPRSFRLPDFAAKDRPATGTEKGVATHLVLQYMDFSKTGSTDEVEGEIERLRRSRFISDREAEAVSAEAIVKLFGSPLGKRMLNAEKMVREFKFSLLCGAEEVFGCAKGDELLMQGVVDCCIEENGMLTIIDYKTDNVKSTAAVKERSRVYEGQLKAYASALERIFKKPVRECVLYFLSAGKQTVVQKM